MDKGISENAAYWLSEATSWPCTCLGSERACGRCEIGSALAATAAAVDLGDWATAHRAVSRAAGQDGRLAALRDRLELLASTEREGRMEVTTEPRFSCGLTRTEHVEACEDAIVRGAEYLLAEHHDEEIGTHLSLVTHLECGATLATALPGHVTDEGEVSL